METRIEELCNRPVILPRDFDIEPVTPQELLDCLLLTAALDREYAPQLKEAMEAYGVCMPAFLDLAKKNLGELRRLPDTLRENPTVLTDYVDNEDRLPEMTQAGQALRAIAAEKKSRNPQTGEEVISPATQVPVFKAGKALKDAVAGK